MKMMYDDLCGYLYFTSKNIPTNKRFFNSDILLGS